MNWKKIGAEKAANTNTTTTNTTTTGAGTTFKSSGLGHVYKGSTKTAPTVSTDTVYDYRPTHETQNREKIKHAKAEAHYRKMNGLPAKEMRCFITSDKCSYELYNTPVEHADKKAKCKGQFQYFVVEVHGYTASGTLHGASRAENLYKDIFAAIASTEKKLEVYGRGKKSESHATIYWVAEDGTLIKAARVTRTVTRYYQDTTPEV